MKSSRASFQDNAASILALALSPVVIADTLVHLNWVWRAVCAVVGVVVFSEIFRWRGRTPASRNLVRSFCVSFLDNAASILLLALIPVVIVDWLVHLDRAWRVIGAVAGAVVFSAILWLRDQRSPPGGDPI